MTKRPYYGKCPVCVEKYPGPEKVCPGGCDPALARPGMRRRGEAARIARRVAAADAPLGTVGFKRALAAGMAKLDPRFARAQESARARALRGLRNKNDSRGA